jgi:hypothetical protein
MNFFMNSGSIPIIAILIWIDFIVMILLLKVAVANFQNKCCRRVGMRAEQDINLFG